MSITIDGTTGISGNNGSASTPAIQGEDTNTGIFFPAADTVAVATGGAERMRIDASGNLLVGLTSGGKFSVSYGGNDTHFGLGANYDNYITAGASGVTILRNGSTERLRIGSSGQVGIGGANYGTSGQVLTSGGSGAAPSWASVGSAIAGFTTASVGTFAFCNNASGSTLGENATVAGSSLRLSDSRDLSGSALAGTWRNMGNSIVTGGPATLFLRIS